MNIDIGVYDMLKEYSLEHIMNISILSTKYIDFIYPYQKIRDDLLLTDEDLFDFVCMCNAFPL